MTVATRPRPGSAQPTRPRRPARPRGRPSARAHDKLNDNATALGDGLKNAMGAKAAQPHVPRAIGVAAIAAAVVAEGVGTNGIF
jgi:hypothetical protein